jgi:hypothetical protein
MTAFSKQWISWAFCCAGKTQLVKGKLAQLPEDMASLAISFNYFTDVISFQKILESPLEKKVSALVSDHTCSSNELLQDPWLHSLRCNNQCFLLPGPEIPDAHCCI